MKIRKLPLAVVAFALTTLTLAGTTYANGQQVAFDNSWKEQGFLRLFSNDYGLRGRQLDVVSNGTVSILWRPLGSDSGATSGASWDWSVAEGVNPTNLTQRGGDDRNLAIYFVFVDPETAKDLNRNSARKLLNNPNTKALVYVWGGNHKKGSLLASPYSPGLKTKVLRAAQTGSFAEGVNLDRDFAAAFGDMSKVLVGLAVTADSDDTKGRIRASIRDLRLQ